MIETVPHAQYIYINGHTLEFDGTVENCGQVYCVDCPFGSGAMRFLWPLEEEDMGSAFWAAMSHAWIMSIPDETRQTTAVLIGLSGVEAGLRFLLEQMPEEHYDDSWAAR